MYVRTYIHIDISVCEPRTFSYYIPFNLNFEANNYRVFY